MIVTDEKLLRLPCSPVSSLEEAKSIIASLEQELNQSALNGRPGIGLAAPQIGIYKNAAIIRINNKLNYNLNLINARIKQGYDKTIFNGEGCLSFPDKYESTMRFQEIYVVNNLVEPYSFVATGLLAVGIQHELDHTLGILLPDIAIKSKNTPKSSNSFLKKISI